MLFTPMQNVEGREGSAAACSAALGSVSGRQSLRIANKPKPMLAMEQQATCLLMKKCGLLEEEALFADKENAFREQFQIR